VALKDWSLSRILSIWTGWMSGLLLLLLGFVVVTPGGVSISVPGNLPLGVRILLGLAGFVAACLPPAAVTFAWYNLRLRAWADAPPARSDPRLEPALRADVEGARQLTDGPLYEPLRQDDTRVPARRSNDA
jgi:hypothetical protein